MRTILGGLIGKKVDLGTKPIFVLVLENPVSYFEVCRFAFLGFRGEKEPIAFLENDKEVEPEFIENLFYPDLNTKKNLNALYKRLRSFAPAELDAKLEDLRKQMETIVVDISLDFEGELTCSGALKAEELFKMFDLRFVDEDLDGQTRLIRYITASHELAKTSIFCVRGLHQCFTAPQICALAKELEYKNITLVSFESNRPDIDWETEGLFIADSDLCTLQ